jgi:hypothetical protein
MLFSVDQWVDQSHTCLQCGEVTQPCCAAYISGLISYMFLQCRKETAALCSTDLWTHHRHMSIQFSRVRCTREGTLNAEP